MQLTHNRQSLPHFVSYRYNSLQIWCSLWLVKFILQMNSWSMTSILVVDDAGALNGSVSSKCQNGLRKLYSCFAVVFRSFTKDFPLGAPGDEKLRVNLNPFSPID